MFSKLPIKHNIPYQSSNDIYNQYGVFNETGFSGITYYSVSEEIGNIILNTFPWLPPSEYTPLLMVINRAEIPPHNDDGIKVSINFYIDTADAVTRFHKIKDNVDPKISKLPNQTNGSLYDPVCLEQTGEFKAESGDVYILDVTRLHSVSCGVPETRTAYVIQSKLFSYEHTLRLFQNHQK